MNSVEYIKWNVTIFMDENISMASWMGRPGYQYPLTTALLTLSMLRP